MSFVQATDAINACKNFYYTDIKFKSGKPGLILTFEQNDGTEIFDVVRLPMPDCYEIVGKGYIRVPDLKTSVFLRTKGNSFKCRCKKYDDEFWDVAENIPDVNVNA